jgi:branched-chain amino acid transport system substrate-binding protein
MTNSKLWMPSRRTVLKAGLAAGAMPLAAPYISTALGEETIKLGMVDPITGVYAALAKNEIEGAKLAVEEINAKGGITGRQVELLVEDSANDAGTGVQKANKLIDGSHISLLIGDVNSAIALALAQVANQKNVLHIVSGGHTDAVTGKSCHWSTFRVCNTTRMETNAVGKAVADQYGKKWFFLTADYAFGHTLQQGMEASLKEVGGTVAGTALAPLGTTDFSAYLIQAQAAQPDAIIVLNAGQDTVNSLKQIVQFGIDKQIHIAGAQQELEVLKALPPEARIGTWVFEWYWKQPGVAGVDAFVDTVKKRTGAVPTARTWFGYTAVHTYGLVANQEKTLDPVKLAHALQGFALPPEVALQPNKAYYRAEDHQLMTSLYVGKAKPEGGESGEDLFDVANVVAGDKAAPPASETGCTLTWPS